MTQIENIRLRMGMSRKDLAGALETSEASLSRWERGQHYMPIYTAWRLIHLARARRVGASLERIYPDPTIGDEA